MALRRRRPVVLLVAVGLAMVGGAAGWSTTTPEGEPAPAPVELRALERAVGRDVPADVAAVAARLPGAMPGARVLVDATDALVVAQPTRDGNLCVVVRGVAGGVTAGCGARLDAERPASALLVPDAGGLLVAGVAADGVRLVEAVGAAGRLCAAVVQRNGFACRAAATAADVRGLAATSEGGVTVTFPVEAGAADAGGEPPGVEPGTITAEPHPVWALLDRPGRRSQVIPLDPATLRPLPPTMYGPPARIGLGLRRLDSAPGARRVLATDADPDRALLRSVYLAPAFSEHVRVLWRGRGARVVGAVWPRKHLVHAIVERDGVQHLLQVDPFASRGGAHRVLAHGGWRVVAGPGRWLIAARDSRPGHPPELLLVSEHSQSRVQLPGVTTIGAVAASPDGRRLVLFPRVGPAVEVDLRTSTAVRRPRPDVTPDRHDPRRDLAESPTVAWLDNDTLVLTGVGERGPAGARVLSRMATWTIDTRTWAATALPVAASAVGVVDGRIVLTGAGTVSTDLEGGRALDDGTGLVVLDATGVELWRAHPRDTRVTWDREPGGSRLYVRAGAHASRGEVRDERTGAVLATWAPPAGASLTLLDPAAPPG